MPPTSDCKHQSGAPATHGHKVAHIIQSRNRHGLLSIAIKCWFRQEGKPSQTYKAGPWFAAWRWPRNRQRLGLLELKTTCQMVHNNVFRCRTRISRLVPLKMSVSGSYITNDALRGRNIHLMKGFPPRPPKRKNAVNVAVS